MAGGVGVWARVAPCLKARQAACGAARSPMVWWMSCRPVRPRRLHRPRRESTRRVFARLNRCCPGSGCTVGSVSGLAV